MSERVPESDYAPIEPGETELVHVTDLDPKALWQYCAALSKRVADLESKLTEMHAEMALVDTIRYRRHERREMDRRAAMAAVGKLAPDERAARVRAMSPAELALFWTAIDDRTVLQVMGTLTAEERAAHLVHVRLPLHDKVRLIDFPAPERVRVEVRQGVRYHAPDRRAVSKATHAALKKAGLASWLYSDGDSYFVKCINPPSVMLRAEWDALVQSGEPASEFTTATPLEPQERDAFHLDMLRRERDQLSRPLATMLV